MAGRHLSGADRASVSTYTADRYLRCGNWNGNSSANNPVLARLAIVGRGRLGNALAAALGRRRLRGARPASGAAMDGAGADVVLLCVPDGEIAAARAARSPPGRWSATARARPGWTPLAPHEAFSMHPLMTVTATGRQFAGAGAAIAGSYAPGARRWPRRSRGRSGCEPVEVADARPRRLPRRRLDRLELPRHARGGGRAARRQRRRRARAAGAAGARDGRELGGARARARADRTGRARRRGDGRRPARCDRRARAGAGGAVRRAGRGDPRARRRSRAPADAREVQPA